MPDDHWGRPSPFSTAKSMRWKAIEKLCHLLPQPYNYTSYVGYGMRKLRLENELAEFDFLHRLNRGTPAGLDKLYCAGLLLLTSSKDPLPAQILPLDENFIINDQTFDALLEAVNTNLDESGGGRAV